VASVVSLLVIALALAGGWWASALVPDARSPLASALDLLPARTTVVGFTDWKGIREHLGLGSMDTARERAVLTNHGDTRDLSTRSVIAPDIETMHEALGWSAADADWEVYGQDPVAVADVLRLRGSISFDDVRSGLRRLGFSQKDGIWTNDNLSTVLPTILKHVALDPRRRLVVMSEQAAGVSAVRDVVGGDGRSLAGIQSAADTATALSGSDSVLLQRGRLACETTAVGDGDVARQASAAVQRAGGLRTYRFSGRGLQERGGAGFSGQRLVVAMTFESAVVASDQAQVRRRLATGPFIGRSGQIDDTLRLRSASSSGSTVRLAFAHDPDTTVFMTGSGPLLFGACSA
jgi:hypothetical protein